MNGLGSRDASDEEAPFKTKKQEMEKKYTK